MKKNKLIEIVKKALVLVTLFSFCFTSCDIAHSYGLPKKIGDAEAIFSGNEILVKNFPHYTIGIVGLNVVGFGTFSFNELDRFIYEIAKKTSLDEIFVTIQYTEEDKYGKKTDGEKITIGKVNVYDTKQYTDFEHWNQTYSTNKMFWKDKEEYDELIKRRTNNSPFNPAYAPKDLKNITPWVIDENSLINISSSVDSTNNNSYSEKTNNDNKYLEEKRNEEERIAGELRWTNPVYLKNRMDEIVFKILGEDNIQTGAQFNLVCQESEEFYKLINRYMELTGENPY